MKRDHQKLDEDNVCREFKESFIDTFTSDNPGRFRFFDIMANRLNTRRAMRQLVLPQLESLHAELAELRGQIRDLVARLAEGLAPFTGTLLSQDA